MRIAICICAAAVSGGLLPVSFAEETIVVTKKGIV